MTCQRLSASAKSSRSFHVAIEHGHAYTTKGPSGYESSWNTISIIAEKEAEQGRENLSWT